MRFVAISQTTSYNYRTIIAGTSFEHQKSFKIQKSPPQNQQLVCRCMEKFSAEDTRRSVNDSHQIERFEHKQHGLGLHHSATRTEQNRNLVFCREESGSAKLHMNVPAPSRPGQAPSPVCACLLPSCFTKRRNPIPWENEDQIDLNWEQTNQKSKLQKQQQIINIKIFLLMANCCYGWFRERGRGST